MLIITGTRVSLREITNDDLPTLHRWRNDPSFIGACSTRRNEVFPESFQAELASDFARDRHLQCLVLRHGTPLGTVYSYGLNRTDGYLFVTTYIVPPMNHRGYGAEAFILFLSHLFDTLSLYKAYADVYSYNLHSLTCLKKGGFTEEGRFVGHRLYNGRRYDLLRLAIFRSQMGPWHACARRLQQQSERRTTWARRTTPATAALRTSAKMQVGPTSMSAMMAPVPTATPTSTAPPAIKA